MAHLEISPSFLQLIKMSWQKNISKKVFLSLLLPTSLLILDRIDHKHIKISFSFKNVKISILDIFPPIPGFSQCWKISSTFLLIIDHNGHKHIKICFSLKTLVINILDMFPILDETRILPMLEIFV